MLQDLQNLKKATLKPVYLFYGNESYLIDEAFAIIKNKVVEKGSSLNTFSYHGKENKVEEIIRSIQTYPMFTPRQLIRIKQVEELSKENLVKLESCLQNPNDFSITVLMSEKVDMRKKNI